MTIGKVHAIIVDIDGTLALHDGRGPYEFDKVLGDRLNMSVAKIIDAVHLQGYDILFTTGRPARAYEDTHTWLDNHGWGSHDIFMRENGDYRKDAVVKEEIYREFIEPHYEVMAVFDDRDAVVEMWRRIGLTCLQVASGDF